jgi:hypothetical protein
LFFSDACACFLPEPGQNVYLPLSKKKQAGFEIVGRQCHGAGFRVTLCISIHHKALSNAMPTLVKLDRLRAACTMLCVLLALIFFGGIIESQESPFPFRTVSLVINKAHQLTASERLHSAPLLLIHDMQHIPRIVHASCLLFDFKQNLRRWPVLAGDITRSPPFSFNL